MILLVLLSFLLSMFVLTSENIKAVIDDDNIENTGITIKDAENNEYEYNSTMYGNGNTITRNHNLKGPVEVNISSDNGTFCGYYTSCVTLRGDYSYNLNVTGTYTFIIIDYYISSVSTKDTWVTYNITVTVTNIIEDNTLNNSSSNSLVSNDSPCYWYTDDIYTIYSGIELSFKLVGVPAPASLHALFFILLMVVSARGLFIPNKKSFLEYLT